MNIKRLLPAVLTITALTMPFASHAEAHSDVYADSVVVSNATYAPDNALGAPDASYADFQDSGASVTLDMGEGEEGTGDLTIDLYLLQYGAGYQVDFLDADMNVLQTSSDFFQAYATQVTIAYAGTTPYRYARITSLTSKQWRLDAVTAASVSAPEASSDAAPETTVPTDETTAAAPSSQGLLVKLVDDGDPATTADAAIYEIGADGMRHVFPSKAVYDTWFHNFDDVTYIDPVNLANYPLGKNVTVRPGTKLVKIQSDPKVYAVGTGRALHWITTEGLAQSLYGTDWPARVIDIPDTAWNNYTVGDPVTADLHPDGTVGALPGTQEIVYVDAYVMYSLPAGVSDEMRFSEDDFVWVTSTDESSFATHADLTNDPNVAFPY